MTTTQTDKPVRLGAGSHSDPETGMCIMEYVSWKYGLGFSDLPSCTEYAVARAAQIVNDNASDEDRQRLVLLVDRLFAAKPVADPVKAKRVLVRLSVWSARSVLEYIVDDHRRAEAEGFIALAEGWLEGTPIDAAASAYASASADASYASASAAAAYAAASAAAYDDAYAAAYAAASASAAYAAYASAAYDAAYAAAYAASAAPVVVQRDSVLWLDELLDAYDKARAEEGVLVNV